MTTAAADYLQDGGGDGAFSDRSLVCTMSRLVGSEVEVLTTGNERIRGILDTFSAQFAVVLKTIGQQTADSEPKMTTIVIEKKHLISLKGKFSVDSMRSNFLDHAIASNQQLNGLKEDANAELVPWEDDCSTSEEQVNLMLEENEPGWDSSNMISTFEKANPGKTSYLGMEQYTNVEVPELSEDEVREISQIVDQTVPIDDDYKEDDTRTEEERFAAVDRPNTRKSAACADESTKKQQHYDGKAESQRSSQHSGQNAYPRYPGSTRRKDHYNAPRMHTLNYNRRINAASPSSSHGENYTESQSARSSPYLKKSSPQPSNYYPRRVGRGSLRFPSGRSRYRGHPSLPIEIPRVNNQQTSSYYYNKSARQSPIRRYELEMYDRQSVGVMPPRQPMQQASVSNNAAIVSNEQQPHSSDDMFRSMQRPTGAADANEVQPRETVGVQDDVGGTTSESAAEAKHSQLNPMASAFVPTRQIVQSEDMSENAQTSEIPDQGAAAPLTPGGTAIMQPFALTPLLQALPTAMTATPITPFAPMMEPFGRGYDAAMAANCAAFAAAQLAATRRPDMQFDGARPPRKAVVSVNMPVVENPFLVQSRPVTYQRPVDQERKARRFVLTSNETSTTIQVPSGGILMDNAETGSTSANDQQSQDATDGVVMAGTFSPQPQSSPKEPVCPPMAPNPAAFSMAPPGQQGAAAINPGMYAPTYYVINPAALAASGLIATQPTLYQSMPFMPSYPFCGYPTTPISFVPLTTPFATPPMLQGQESLMEQQQQPQRRPRFANLGGGGGGRRYSESVVPGSRSSATSQETARMDSPQKTSIDSRRVVEDSRRKTNPALSDGDSRRFTNRRRSGQDGGNNQPRHQHDPDHPGRRGSSVQQHYAQSRHEHFRRNR